MSTAETLPRPGLLLPAHMQARHKLLIGGEWRDARSGETIPVEDPATGEIIAYAASGDAADVDDAARAARKALEGPWSQISGMQRTKLMLRLADLLETKIDEFALIETHDVGQPLFLSRGAATGVPDLIRYYAGWATRITGETIAPLAAGNWHAYTVREPVGVVAMIVPWNAPYSSTIPKLCSALAAGCTVIVKPAEQTPLATVRLGELILEAGFPEGVVNVVTGYGHTAGAALTVHPEVDKISFTGSTETGAAIMRAAAGSMKRVTLELGGKSPVIVLPDADLDKVVEATAAGIFRNSGQICVAGSRLIAHRNVFDRVVEGVAKEAQKLRVGPGTEDGVMMGPLVSAAQLERVSGFVAQGRADGAELVTGGERIGERGYFIQPTVLAGVDSSMSVMQDEIFGPVLCAMSFDDEDLAQIAREANNTRYGLAASIWTRDIGAAHRLAKMIRVGSVKINSREFPDSAMPFGGYKQSGLGRERGRAGVEMYTELKSVIVGL